MTHVVRREFLRTAAATTMAATAIVSEGVEANATKKREASMSYGLVTYMWGAKWDLPTLLANCEQTRCLGVELRTTHAHAVEPALNVQERKEIAKRFEDSPVTLVGIGSNERYDNPDGKVVRQAIDATKRFIELSHDVGGTGVKVKPDKFHKGVPHGQTIEQIGRALNELGEFAVGYGQQIRLEVHGECRHLPTIKSILDVADHENVAICWNCNPADLEGEGLEHNFNLVRDRFGATIHVRRFENEAYPTRKLIDMLLETDYEGWFMLESGAVPDDPVAALATQVRTFNEILAS